MLVVGYLAPLLKLPLPNDRLQLHLKSCINLVQLIDSTLRIYLPLNEEGEKLYKKYSNLELVSMFVTTSCLLLFLLFRDCRATGDGKGMGKT